METVEIPGVIHQAGVDSDPTYEAWKLILMMVLAWMALEFRSYLRGMETSRKLIPLSQVYLNSDPTYEAWKLFLPNK